MSGKGSIGDGSRTGMTERRLRLEPEKKYSLHFATWENNGKSIERQLGLAFNTFRRTSSDPDQPAIRSINTLDNNGNTALHIAIALGHREIARMLLTAGANPKTRNRDGWTSIQEVCVIGDKEMACDLFLQTQLGMWAVWERRRPELAARLEAMPDCHLEMKWEFKSWVPFVSRFCPNDTYHVYKRGSQVRIDTTLVDFRDYKWVRGNLSFHFTGGRKGTVMVVDHDKRIVTDALMELERPPARAEIMEDIDLFMETEHMRTDISTKQLEFKRATNWFGWSEKSEKIGAYDTDVYEMKNLEYTQLIRKQKPETRAKSVEKSKEERSAQKKFSPRGRAGKQQSPRASESAKNPGLPGDMGKEAKAAEQQLRTANKLDKNPASTRTQEQGEYVLVETKKSFNGTIWMTDQFELTLQELLPLLEVTAPSGPHFETFKAFLGTKLPPGFPVKIEIPVFPTITATVTFSNYQAVPDMSRETTAIPSSYYVRSYAEVKAEAKRQRDIRRRERERQLAEQRAKQKS